LTPNYKNSRKSYTVVKYLFPEQNAKVANKKGRGTVSSAGYETGEEPNSTVFVENLPTEANESMLNLLFSQFPGFKKSRPIPAGGKAFIEFMEAAQASTAKDALQGFKVTPERPIKLSFAKN
jgi:RNA recognition motif-containing protein